MSSYKDLVSCATDMIKQYKIHIEAYEGDNIEDFFNHADHINFVNDLVITYHYEILKKEGNNYLPDKRAPAGIFNLANKLGVIFPKGLSIKNNERVHDIFLMRIKDYRESRNLTKKRVIEIRRQTRSNNNRLRMRRQRQRSSELYL